MQINNQGQSVLTAVIQSLLSLNVKNKKHKEKFSLLAKNNLNISFISFDKSKFF